MSDTFVSKTGLTYFYNRLKTVFAGASDVSDIDTRVESLEDAGVEANVIDTVKVNGTALTPDNQKAVDVTVPTTTSQLTNNGDGTSDFATEDYVDTYGGKIDVIKVNGTSQTITGKEVDISVPTKVSDITNDSGFQTAADVSGAIATALNGITGISFSIVQTLPATGEQGIIYLIANNGAAPNIYDEYIYVNNAFEKIGTTEVDLSGYMRTTDMVAITTAEIDTIVV